MDTQEEYYYDLVSNMIPIRDKDVNKIIYAKFLEYPGTIKCIWCITETGDLYCIPEDTFVDWKIDYQGNPYIELAFLAEQGYIMIPVNIKDIMAYNFIGNSDSYLERGMMAININGNKLDNRYQNIKYIPR